MRTFSRSTLLITTVVTAVFAFAGGAVASTALFTDVPGDHWAATAIQNMRALGLMVGDGDKFRPNDAVTRAELAVILNRAVNPMNNDLANPTAALQDARDAQRRSDINTILNAIYQYAIDHNGNWPATLTSSSKEICRTQAKSCAGKIVLDRLLEMYLVSIPEDPTTNDEEDNGTGYKVSIDANGRITVTAPLAEGGSKITVTR